MERDGQAIRPAARAGLRQALVALVASAVVIGGIVAVSGSKDEDSVSLAGSSTTSTITAITPSSSPGTLPGLGAPPPLAGTEASSATLDSVAVTAPPSVDAGATTTSSTVTSSSIALATTGTLPDGSTAIPLAADAPAISGTAYAVFDATNDRWLSGNQPDAPLPVGSIMKLLTSYVVLHAGDPTKVVTVPKLTVDIEESSIGLYQGEQLPRDVLFRAMIIVSANDAARTLATDIGGSVDGFVQMMNSAASELGLSNTVAANPIGLDEAGAHSSVRDIIRLADLLMQDPTFAAAVAKPTAKLHGKVWNSTNRLLTTYEGADGVKTGHTTQAGYCLVASAVRGGRRLLVAVLGSPSEDQRFSDAAALLDWGFAH